METDRDNRTIWLIALAMCAVYGAFAYFLVTPRSTDMVLRYAPQADAFARGRLDWSSIYPHGAEVVRNRYSPELWLKAHVAQWRGR